MIIMKADIGLIIRLIECKPITYNITTLTISWDHARSLLDSTEYLYASYSTQLEGTTQLEVFKAVLDVDPPIIGQLSTLHLTCTRTTRKGVHMSLTASMTAHMHRRAPCEFIMTGHVDATALNNVFCHAEMPAGRIKALTRDVADADLRLALPAFSGLERLAHASVAASLIHGLPLL
mmetsp:Transcript_53638/g.116940  ORF Transcript_53638/g.116940 Transcript_53638/m.116940 type:complete len:177 (+) Transcript_53638:442-972(+)